MEAESTFVWSDAVVELDSPGSVDSGVAGVIHPGDSEGDDAVWFCDSLKNGCFLVGFVVLNEREDAFGYFMNGLMKIWFSGVSFFKSFDEAI